MNIKRQGKKKRIVSGLGPVLFLVLLAGCGNQENSEEHLQKGLEYLNKGEYEKARIELKNSSQAGKNNADAYYALALLDEKNRHYKAMRENLEKAVELAPEKNEARLKLGKVLLLFNEPAAALEQANTVLGKNANEWEAQALKASALIKQKKQDEALSILNVILAAKPDFVEALSLKAVIFMEKDDFSQALPLLEKALKADPKNISLHVLKIQMDAKRNNIDAIIDDYRQLAALYPDNSDFKISLAQAYAQAGKNKEAEELLRSLIAQEPNNIRFKLLLLDYFIATDKDKVADQFRQFTAQHQDQPRRLLELAEWMIGRRDFEEAKKPLNHVIELEKDSNVGLAAKTLLAKMAFDKKDYDGAQALVQEILSDNSNYNDAKILQARLWLVKEKYDDAIDLLNKVLFSEPNSEEALLLLGQSHLVKGNQKEADKFFANVLKVNPGNLQAIAYVYDSAVKNHNTRYAKEILEQGVRLNNNNIALLEKLAQLYIAENDWPAATAAVDKIKDLSNPLAQDLAGFLQGQIYQNQGNCAKAIEKYKDLLQKLPEDSNALGGMARCYETMNKRPEMIAYLNDLTARNPRNIAAGLLLSDLLILDKNYQKSSALLAGLIKDNPKIAQLYASLAAVKLAQNDNAGALEIYRTGLQQIPDNIQLSLALGSLYETQQNYESAVTLYENLLAKNPQLDVIRNNLAALLTDHIGKPEALNKAAGLTEKFKNSDQPYFQDTYAWILVNQGQVNEGLKILSRIALKSPDVAVFRYHLGAAHYKSGNNAAAMAELKQALELAQTKDSPLDTKKVEALLEEVIRKTMGH